jgi:large subunit ribosomal protein L28
MAKCEICGKGRQFGHNRPFSLKATNRHWKPNIQKATVTVDGRQRKMQICTRCLRTMNKTK